MQRRREPNALLSVDTAITVPFFDVDSMNIVWHGHYCKYLEVARCNLLDKLGYNYTAMKQSGFMFPIVDMQIKYIQPLVFEQQVIVTASLVEWEYRLKIHYTIRDLASNVILTKAHTVQAAVDAQQKTLLIGCPAPLAEKVKALLA
uniref:acyl-CoA thioesterase n=1 Tax=Cellvibrio fontiphilus TaxID=1815559 RepID=UPI002B4BF1C6|nr:acyl-CoA thioesterase [Cellvibrio fontiphilus]